MARTFFFVTVNYYNGSHFKYSLRGLCMCLLCLFLLILIQDFFLNKLSDGDIDFILAPAVGSLTTASTGTSQGPSTSTIPGRHFWNILYSHIYFISITLRLSLFSPIKQDPQMSRPWLNLRTGKPTPTSS